MLKAIRGAFGYMFNLALSLAIIAGIVWGMFSGLQWGVVHAPDVTAAIAILSPFTVIVAFIALAGR